jgi:hypothetical protein
MPKCVSRYEELLPADISQRNKTCTNSANKLPNCTTHQKENNLSWNTFFQYTESSSSAYSDIARLRKSTFNIYILTQTATKIVFFFHREKVALNTQFINLQIARVHIQFDL